MNTVGIKRIRLDCRRLCEQQILIYGQYEQFTSRSKVHALFWYVPYKGLLIDSFSIESIILGTNPPRHIGVEIGHEVFHETAA